MQLLVIRLYYSAGTQGLLHALVTDNIFICVYFIQYLCTRASHVPGIPLCPFSPGDPFCPTDPFSPLVKKIIMIQFILIYGNLRNNF